MKKWLSVLKLGESGQAMLAVLALMVLGGFLVIPALNFASTSLKTTNMFEKKLDGLYAADAGVEDALWKLKYATPDDLPYSYQLANVNGMSVDVTIARLTTIAGEEIDQSGGHVNWLASTVSVTYDVNHYNYTLSVTNNGSGNIYIEKILLDFPPGVEYVDDSTVSEIIAGDPGTISGSSATGITLVWTGTSDRISPDETKEHSFELSGPPGIQDIEGHGLLEATRADIGTSWISGIIPYSITAQAKDASNKVVATIRAGVWGAIDPDISCWQVNP